MKTYRMDSIENCWAALEAAHTLFRQVSHYFADNLNYIYPDYDVQVTSYINKNIDSIKNRKL